MQLETVSDRVAALAECVRLACVTDRAGWTSSADAGIGRLAGLLDATRAAGAVYVVGNGGSAAIAAHIVNDFVKACDLRSFALHDAAVLTCLANDYGYENAYAEYLKRAARAGDVLVAISSSGRSSNIINATAVARAAGASVVTLSGFEATNPLRSCGDLNFWVGAADYGLVEIAHLFLLHHASTRLSAARGAGAGLGLAEVAE